jgi:glycosyltransferase involved in cell wall biosynthesis
VIGPNYGLLSWLVSEYKVGICVDINNPREIGSRIVEMLQNTESMEAFRRKAAQISLSHLPRSFAGAVCDAIAAGRGGRARPESSTLRTPAAL